RVGTRERSECVTGWGELSYNKKVTHPAAHFIRGAPLQDRVKSCVCFTSHASEFRMPNAPLIAYRNVGKSFDDGRVVAVDDVSLEVFQGEVLAIVGGSGSGKTTLLRLANRLIDADGGTIMVEGEDVRALDPVGLRRRIGYVFQSGALFPHMSVADN